MYTIIVGILIAFILSLIAVKNTFGTLDFGNVIGITFLFCLVLTIPTHLIFYSQCEYRYDNPKLISSVELYAGYNNPQINGNFYLLSGTIEEEEYIFYWKKESDGAITRHKEPFWENTRFFEKDIDYGVKNVYEIPCVSSNWLICEKVQTVEYIVPTGSIVSGYTFE